MWDKLDNFIGSFSNKGQTISKKLFPIKIGWVPAKVC